MFSIFRYLNLQYQSRINIHEKNSIIFISIVYSFMEMKQYTFKLLNKP